MKFETLIFLGIIKTLYVNFKCCRFKDAIKLPIIVSRNTSVLYCKSNCFEFVGGGKFGILTIGFNRRNNKGLHSSLKIKGKVIVRGNKVHSFGAGCSIDVGKSAVLDIGDNFICTGDSYITVRKSIIIGDNNLWSFNEVVMDTDYHYIYDRNWMQTNISKPVYFGNNIWLACNCIILKGSSIPSNTVVAAGSLISKVVAEENNVISSQGKVLKRDVMWTQYKKKVLTINNSNERTEDTI